MGPVNSTGNKLEKALAADLPENERYFGLENFGNTCYCNSVLQALYFCEPFRRAILDYAQQRRHPPPSASHDAPNAPAASHNPVPNALSAISASLSSTVADSNYAPSSASSAAASSAPYANGAPQHTVYNKSHTSHLASSSTAPGSSDPSSLSASTAAEDTMLTALADLFTNISSQKKRTGSVPPKSFVNKLRQENELFSSYMHQDAHEFLNFILNDVVECLENDYRKSAALRSARRRPRMQNGVAPHVVHAADGEHDGAVAPDNAGAPAPAAESDSEDERPARTFVHDLFEGELSNEVRCLCCETITQRVESFFDLSVDVEQNSSLTACLRSFSSTELLEKQDKFFCDACCSLQEAERRMRIKRVPRILALHLKRFKYVEQLGKYKKLSYRVVFPLELRLCNTSDYAEDPDRLYSLFAVVVHVGSGPNQGHYVSLIKSHGQWLMFDDDCVEPKDESEIQSVYGVTQDSAQSTEAGYILFYEQMPSNV